MLVLAGKESRTRWRGSLHSVVLVANIVSFAALMFPGELSSGIPIRSGRCLSEVASVVCGLHGGRRYPARKRYRFSHWRSAGSVERHCGVRRHGVRRQRTGRRSRRHVVFTVATLASGRVACSHWGSSVGDRTFGSCLFRSRGLSCRHRLVPRCRRTPYDVMSISLSIRSSFRLDA
jgi:hypothetical protein